MERVKNKGRILKSAREKQLATHKENFVRFSADFAAQILQARKKFKKESKKKIST